MTTAEGDRQLALIADMEPGKLLAAAALVAALLFGIAGVIGSIGYLVAVTRYR